MTLGISIGDLLSDALESIFPSADEARELAIQERITPPKARPRKRRLSLPLDDNLVARVKTGKIRRQKTLDQSQSPLLQLPAELRVKIYEELIKLGREKYNVARIGAYNLRPYAGTVAGTYDTLGVWKKVDEDECIWGIGIMGLLRSCRRIYTEFIPYVYKLPTFYFTDVHSFFTFMITIPPHRVTQLRYVRLGFRPSEASWPYSAFYLDYGPIKKVKAMSQLPGWPEAGGMIRMMSYKWAVDEVRKNLLKGLVGGEFVGGGEVGMTVWGNGVCGEG